MLLLFHTLGIVVNIDNVTCSVDGNITIKVNNWTEDTISLIVTGRYVTIIIFHHECEGRIEKPVPRITVWHHEAC